MSPALTEFAYVGIPGLIEELHVPTRTLGVHGWVAAGKQIGFVAPAVILCADIVVGIDTIQAEASIVIVLELGINGKNVILCNVQELVVVTRSQSDASQTCQYKIFNIIFHNLFLL